MNVFSLDYSSDILYNFKKYFHTKNLEGEVNNHWSIIQLHINLIRV